MTGRINHYALLVTLAFIVILGVAIFKNTSMSTDEYGHNSIMETQKTSNATSMGYYQKMRPDR